MVASAEAMSLIKEIVNVCIIIKKILHHYLLKKEEMR
jgi:hypothetical protein